MLAVFEVKKTGEKLKALDFPPVTDETAINDTLNKEMPNYKAIIKAEVKFEFYSLKLNQKHYHNAYLSISIYLSLVESY